MLGLVFSCCFGVDCLFWAVVVKFVAFRVVLWLGLPSFEIFWLFCCFRDAC